MKAVIPFERHCARVQQRLEGSYGIRVVTRDIPDPLTGDLDGAEIQIDYAVTPEQRLFLLAHLFGHTVQWNTDPGAFEIGQLHQPPVPEDRVPGLLAYEREAAGYALALFHQCGIDGADQWLADSTSCDLDYLLHYYRTGEKKDFLAFWRDHTPLLQPKPIPQFTPSRRTFRREGLVI
jgi:hypothetical protein